MGVQNPLVFQRLWHWPKRQPFFPYLVSVGGREGSGTERAGVSSRWGPWDVFFSPDTIKFVLSLLFSRAVVVERLGVNVAGKLGRFSFSLHPTWNHSHKVSFCYENLTIYLFVSKHFAFRLQQQIILCSVTNSGRKDYSLLVLVSANKSLASINRKNTPLIPLVWVSFILLM